MPYQSSILVKISSKSVANFFMLLAAVALSFWTWSFLFLRTSSFCPRLLHGKRSSHLFLFQYIDAHGQFTLVNWKCFYRSETIKSCSCLTFEHKGLHKFARLTHKIRYFHIRHMLATDSFRHLIKKKMIGSFSYYNINVPLSISLDECISLEWNF